MKKYLKYLGYILRHKWYVGLECFKRGLIWRGIMHDMSKLLPSEFIPYANYFYGDGNDISRGRDETGYYKPAEVGDEEFVFAWLLHQKRNRHHWHWWILPEDEGGVKILEIREPYFTEMVCDWIGAGKAQGYFSPKDNPLEGTRKWWKKNNHKMQLNSKTRDKMEELLRAK